VLTLSIPRISFDEDDDSDWDDTDETVSIYRASDIVKAINVVWVKFMVSFPFVESDRTTWVDKLLALKPIGATVTETRELFAPAVEAGLSGWKEVMKLFEAKKAELDQQGIVLDDDEDEDVEEDEFKVKRTSDGALEIDLTEDRGKDKKGKSAKGKEKEKEKEADKTEKGKEKAAMDVEGDEKGKDKSDEDGEDDFVFEERPEVTQARLTYLQEHGFFKEALLLMKYAKQLKGTCIFLFLFLFLCY